MSANAVQCLSPPVSELRDNVTVHVFGPECLGKDFHGIDSGLASTAWTANLLVFVPLVLAEPLLVARMFWRNGGTVNGNTDVGIYNETGTTKLVSTGSVANSGTNVIQSVDVTDTFLPANSRLWLALGSDSATQTYLLANPVVSALDYIGVLQQAAGWSSGLPTSLAFAVPTVAVLPLFGFTGSSVI